MPLASLFSLQWYGPAAGAMVDASQGVAITAIKGTARCGATAAGVGTSPLLKPTRLRNSPMVTAGAGTVPLALPKGRARPSVVIKVNELSQDDVTGALLTAPIYPGFSLRDALRVLASVAAGKTTITPTGGSTATVAFRAIDDSQTVVSASMDGSERDAVTLDP